MQHVEVSCAVRRLFKSLSFKGLNVAPSATSSFYLTFCISPRSSGTLALRSLYAC